jgi:cysteine-rich repeat protein
MSSSFSPKSVYENSHELPQTVLEPVRIPPLSREVFPMATRFSKHSVGRGQASGQLLALGLAALFALAGIACTSAKIENTGGAGGTGQGGVGGSGSSGTGVFIKMDGGPSGTGGTTGLECNSTSTAGCKAMAPEGCGDGINNQNGIEQCDDGNVLPGDGCNGNCKTEPNWTCPPDIRAGACTKNIICGDGQIGPGEVCDDGNTADNDGCNATCTVQDPAFNCVPGEPCVRVSECGNKRIEPGEDCDDGNSTAGDGCDSACHLEGGWVCPNPGQPCKAAPRCGDSVMQPTIGEVCDDGNQADGDGCSADCKTKGAGCV